MDKFKCPITQEVIRDPVVASGEGEGGREGGRKGGREGDTSVKHCIKTAYTCAGE